MADVLDLAGSGTKQAAEHAEIDCVIRGDAAGAADVMRRHIETSRAAKAASRLGADGQVRG
jgi:DNA-binding GntR family transcriptional regulator